jgi:hypothetical protein
MKSETLIKKVINYWCLFITVEGVVVITVIFTTVIVSVAINGDGVGLAYQDLRGFGELGPFLIIITTKDILKGEL